jgi:hypothetical protein
MECLGTAPISAVSRMSSAESSIFHVVSPSMNTVPYQLSEMFTLTSVVVSREEVESVVQQMTQSRASSARRADTMNEDRQIE